MFCCTGSLLNSLLPPQKRVVVRRQEYHAAPIEGTPFSLGIALPSSSHVAYEVAGEIEIYMASENGE